MTKKEIIAWLKVKRENAISKVSGEYADSVRLTQEDIFETACLLEYAEKMQKLIDEFQTLAEEFEARIKAMDGVSLNMYSRASQAVYTFAKSKTAVAEYLRMYTIAKQGSPRFQRLDRKKKELIEGIDANYLTAIENVKACKDAKAAVEYLRGLGFDADELDALDSPKTITALMKPIDPRFLFVHAGAKELHGTEGE